MFFGKLLPKEGNFFELFNQHADRIVEAARAFQTWCSITQTVTCVKNTRKMLTDRKSTRLNSSHVSESRMTSSA